MKKKEKKKTGSVKISDEVYKKFATFCKENGRVISYEVDRAIEDRYELLTGKKQNQS